MAILPTLSAQISSTGIVAPQYSDILTSLELQYQAIYGSDVVLTADTQDGQLLAIFAASVNDANNNAIADYNAFSPLTAQGTGLSTVVEINGIDRLVPTASTATVTVTGVYGTVITNGLIGDSVSLNTQWSLPTSVTIPIGGTIDVVATCTTLGALTALPATLTNILNQTRGWQSVSNAAAATPGNPAESDATLRQRQAASTAQAAETILDGIISAVGNLSNVMRFTGYENVGSTPDANGIPGHSICIVVEGGDPTAILTAISNKKTAGSGTFGTTTQTIVDPIGVPNVISYEPLTDVTVLAQINITALPGYQTTTAADIKAAIAAFISALDIGETSYLNRLWGVANLNTTYVVTAVAQSRSPAGPTAANVLFAFNEAALCAATNVTIVVA